MKSCTSQTPSASKKRVIRMFESGRYICLWALACARGAAWIRRRTTVASVLTSSSGATRKKPPRSASRSAAKTLGESKLGQQYQSIVPSTATSATVWRSPMTPCSAIGG
jgi:hypothetical protein